VKGDLLRSALLLSAASCIGRLTEGLSEMLDFFLATTFSPAEASFDIDWTDGAAGVERYCDGRLTLATFPLQLASAWSSNWPMRENSTSVLLPSGSRFVGDSHDGDGGGGGDDAARSAAGSLAFRGWCACVPTPLPPPLFGWPRSTSRGLDEPESVLTDTGAGAAAAAHLDAVFASEPFSVVRATAVIGSDASGCTSGAMRLAGDEAVRGDRFPLTAAVGG
jgi:hypothetical protein